MSTRKPSRRAEPEPETSTAARRITLPEDERIVSPGEAARILEVSHMTVHRYREMGWLPYVMVGKVKCHMLKDVLRLRAERQAKAVG